MQHLSMRSLVVAFASALLVAACTDTPTSPPAESGTAPAFGVAPGAQPAGAVIATGLNNPRQMVIGPNGSLYVTEAGLGAGNPTDGAAEGLGFTGSVTEIDRPASARPAQQRILTGLVSAAMMEGGELETIGADGIGFADRSAKQRLYVSFGGHGGPGLGLLVGYDGSTPTTIGDVGSADYTWTGDHADLWEEFPDANPYGMLATDGHLYVADAGANTLDEVMPNGDVHVLAFFPNNVIRDAVPTCVARGPDGALYIGTLALVERFSLPGHHAFVYRVDPAQTDPGSYDTVLNVATVWADGFDTISSCAFAPNGDFFATEMYGGESFGGDVVRVPFKHPDQKTRFGEGDVVLPTGIAVGVGAVYVSSFGNSTAAGQGTVVRFRGS